MRRLRRIALPVLALLIVSPVSFGRGGGSGGGGGGGGTSGGSYGGSSSGGSSWGGGSSYRGSSYYDDNDYGNRYGNDYSNGADWTDWRVDLIVVGVVILAAGLLKAKEVLFAPRPYELADWCFLLRNGDRYTKTFERIARDRLFRTPAERQAAMIEMARSIDRSDIVTAHFTNHGTRKRGEILGSQAQAIYDQRSHQVELEKGVEYIHLPTEIIHRDDQANTMHPAASDSMCIFGLVLVSDHLHRPARSNSPFAVFESMRSSGPKHGRSSYLFFYYTPRPGETLAPEKARRLFANVSALDPEQFVVA